MEAKRQLTAEEESIRRNTDCIYFLASPLTCKKGSECEFRHSEVARLNPKECWYWMNSNCLNPRCGFRHPPLDGLFENPRPPAAHAGPYNNTNKQTIPCYYFQKGQCIKGDKCPFMHGFNPIADNSPQQQQQAATMPHEATPNDPQDAHTNSWGLKECTTQPTPPKASTAHSISANKLSSYPSDHELPKPQPISSDSTSSKPPPIEEHYANGREAEDYLGESPGFDVLVDVDGEEYIPREPEFYNSNPNLDQSVNEFDYSHPDYDYEAAPGYEEDGYRRAMESTHKRRSAQRDSSPGGEIITGSDLRHSLLKKRRVNGDHGDYREREGRRGEYRRYGHGDRYSTRNEEISVGSRLQGRIKLPSNEPGDRERRRNRGRSSPVRASEGRSILRDRVRYAPYVERRRRRREDVDSSNFPGPKSLAELKGAKFTAGSEASTVKKGEGEDEVENFDGDDGGYEYEGNEGDDFKGLDEGSAFEDETACVDDEEEFAKKVQGFFE